MRRFWSLAVVNLCVVLAACGPKYRTVTYPPRVNLTEYELIGVIEFESPDSDLAPLLTRRFTESARRDQGIVRMVALGPERARPDVDRIRELGREKGLRSIIVGELTLSDPRPRLSVSPAVSSGSLSASIEATLDVELIETSSGASLWNATARANTTLGGLRVYGGKAVDFHAEDPESAYGALVDALVAVVTQDLHSTWRREPIP